MALSSDLMAQFAKATVGGEKQKTETNAYGTVVMVGEEVYVRLDGAGEDRLIPMETTAEVKDGERVTIRIKNHNATITGNVSSPAARIGSVEEINGKVAVAIEELEAQKAVIKNLNATYATIEELNATKATIESLDAKFVKADELDAKYATVEKLESEYITAEVLNAEYAKVGDISAVNAAIYNLNATYAEITRLNSEKIAANEAVIKNLDTDYANIDFANIGEAAFRKLFADSGIMDNLVVGEDLTVSGEIVGVTIIGDVIKGGTVVADKLVLRDTETGLLYKLNMIGEEIASEQIDQNEYNSLNGSIITAKSITAEKVNVEDLVAFNATIGGFKITNSAIYSGVKESVNNTTEGVYMDRDGQFAVGGTSDYIKYYKVADGSYKLAISAESIMLSSSGISVEAAIEQTKNSITSYVSENYTTKDEFDDLEIGACNLIKNSDFSDGTRLWVISGVTGEVEADETHGSCLKITSTSAPGAEHRIYPHTTDNFIHNGGTYSLSFYAKTDTEAVLQSNVAGDTEVFKNYTLTTSWKRYTFTYQASGGSITFWLAEPNMTAYITKVQVERGNKVTDWSPCPDSVITSVDLDNVNSELSDSIDGVEERLTTNESLIQQLKNEISSLIVDENGASMMTQTEDGVRFSMGTILSDVGNISEAIDTIKNEANDTNATVTSLKHAVDDLEVLTEHVDVGTYTYVDEEGVSKTEPSISLSEGDSEFRHVITNTQAMYMDGSYVPTRIDTNGITTENITIKGELKHCNFKWKGRANGNYGLMWKGGAK